MENELDMLKWMIEQDSNEYNKKTIKSIIKEVYTAKILMKYLNFELLTSDGFYWLKINNQNIYRINENEYNILKGWKR